MPYTPEFFSILVGSMSYCSRGEHESAAELIRRSDGQNTMKCNACVNTDAAAPDLYEVPVSQNQSLYETLVEHRTVGPVTENLNAVLPLYEGLDFGTSSLFYQYVPSKVSAPWGKHIHVDLR